MKYNIFASESTITRIANSFYYLGNSIKISELDNLTHIEIYKYIHILF